MTLSITSRLAGGKMCVLLLLLMYAVLLFSKEVDACVPVGWPKYDDHGAIVGSYSASDAQEAAARGLCRDAVVARDNDFELSKGNINHKRALSWYGPYPPDGTILRHTKTIYAVNIKFLNDEDGNRTVDSLRKQTDMLLFNLRAGLYNRIYNLDVVYRQADIRFNSNCTIDQIHAEIARIHPDINWRDFDHHVLRWSSKGPGSWAGLAISYGGLPRLVYLKSDWIGLLEHEFGHNIGFPHARYISTYEPWPARAMAPYSFFISSSSDWLGDYNFLPYPENDYNAVAKAHCDALPYNTSMIPLDSCGGVRLYAHDAQIIHYSRSKPQYVRLARQRYLFANHVNDFAGLDTDAYYYLEFRNLSRHRGVIVRLESSAHWEPSHIATVKYLGNKHRQNLLPGSMWYDPTVPVMVANRGQFVDPAAENNWYALLDIRHELPQLNAPKPVIGGIEGPTLVNVTLGAVNATYRIPIPRDHDDYLYLWYQNMEPVVSDRADLLEYTFTWSRLLHSGIQTIRVDVTNVNTAVTAVYTLSVNVTRVPDLARPTTPPTFPVSGRAVVSGGNGETPLARAHVYYWDAAKAQYSGAVTNEQGEFTLSQIPAGSNYTFFASHENCVSIDPASRINVSAPGVSGLKLRCNPNSYLTLRAITALPVSNNSDVVFEIKRTGSLSYPLEATVGCHYDLENSIYAYHPNGTLNTSQRFPLVSTTVLMDTNQESATFKLRHLRRPLTSTPVPRWGQSQVLCYLREGLSYLLWNPIFASAALAPGVEAGVNGPVNDNYANATNVGNATRVLVSGLWNNASTEPYEPSTMIEWWRVCPSVWFRWTAPAHGEVFAEVSTAYSYYARLNAFTSPAELSAKLLLGNGRTGQNWVTYRGSREDGKVSFWACGGREYYFQLSSCWLPAHNFGRAIQAPQPYNFTLSMPSPSSQAAITCGALKQANSPNAADVSPERGVGQTTNAVSRSATTFFMLNLMLFVFALVCM
jgi:hypothetical protein